MDILILLATIEIKLLTRSEKYFFLIIGLLFCLISFYWGDFKLFIIGFTILFARKYFHQYCYSSLNALATGKLRDRIYALADRAKVKLEQIYILKEGEEEEIINAYAIKGNKIVLTNSLLKFLNKREIDTIVAHELGHLKHRHLQILTTINSSINLFCFLIVILSIERFKLGIISFFLLIIINFIFSELRFQLLYKLSRHFEYVADAEAVNITGDAIAYIQALNKIDRNKDLEQSNDITQKILTHPPTLQRIKAIARSNNISEKEVFKILKTADRDLVYYSLPDNFLSGQKIFSTNFKETITTKRDRAIAATKILLPIAIAEIIQLLNSSLFFYFLGIIIGLTLFFKSHKWISGWGKNELRKKLKLKLTKQGYSVDKYRGIYVGFTPASQPRFYEKLPEWDRGFLFLTRDRLCYVGEETCFSLSRKQTRAIELGEGIPTWYDRRPRLYISWYDSLANKVNTFNLATTNIHSLHKQLKKWLKFDRNHKITPYLSGDRLLIKLSAPQTKTVTSNSLKNEFKIQKLFSELILLCLLSLAAGFVFDLAVGQIFYTIIFICLASILEITPYYSRRKLYW